MTTTTMDDLGGAGPKPPRAVNARKTPMPVDVRGRTLGAPAGLGPSASSTWPRLRIVSAEGIAIDSDARHAPPPFVSARLVVAAMWVFFAAAGVNTLLG